MRILLLSAAVVLAPLFARAEDFQILFDRKKTGLTQGRGTVGGGHEEAKGGKGGQKGATASEQILTQKWQGEVRVQNRSSKESPELDVRYVVFVKRQQLGQKVGEDKEENVKGEAKLPALKSMAQSSFETNEVELQTHVLLGNVMFKNGGLQRAADDVSGIWIKIMNGTTEVGEYVNPPSLKAKHKFE